LDDIAFINKMLKDYPNDTRRKLSQRLCESWGWYQANGVLKDRKCRGLLLALHRAGHINLPLPTHRQNNNFSRRKSYDISGVDSSPIESKLQQLFPIHIKQVRRTSEEKVCDGLIDKFHYLHYTYCVGEVLKYIVYSLERPIACLIFSSAPRHIGCRDRFIGWNSLLRRANIHLLAYNTRFLILPWIRIPHLASHVLGAISRRISSDWMEQYNHPVYFIETFVDTERFRGTCYKAANWHYLGVTTGRGKNDSTKKVNRSIKAVWGYPLVKDFRSKLYNAT